MRKQIGGFIAACVLLAGAAPAAAQQDIVFLSTQLRPIEEAQKMRETILKGAGVKVTYVVDEPQRLTVRIGAEQQAGSRTISLIGALHGDLLPLAAAGQLAPLDDVAKRLAARGMPASLLELGKLGGASQVYIPWMQATYVMAANKAALPYLPLGADINTLTFTQLRDWAANVQKATGQRRLGFPAGPKGLFARFFQGYLYPSYTGGVVSTYRSAEAEAMWAAFKDLWQYVNPNSNTYDFMQEPLAAGEVWIAWDHIARLKDALGAKPNDFVVFPAPAGPKGRGFMPVLAGLAIQKGAPNVADAAKLIDYLTQQTTQVTTAVETGFFPVIKADLPTNMPPSVKLLAAAIAAQSGAKDALVSLLPVGLGDKGGEFNKVYVDTFQRVVLRGEPVRAVLNAQADELRKVIDATKAPCWAPDKPSQGPCPVN